MEQLQIVASLVELLLFGGLAVVAARNWRERRDRASLWFALTMGILTAVVAGGRLLGDDGEASLWATKALVVVLSLFPYCLYRFMQAFARPPRVADRFVGVMTVVVIGATLALPSFPGPDEARPGWFVAYVVTFLAHWAIVSVLVAANLWRSGRGQPTLVRRRMRLLGGASLALTAALLVSGTLGGERGAAGVAVQATAIASAILFALGYAPPRSLRILWSRPETEALRRAVPRLMAADSKGAVADAILPGIAGILGSKGAALLDPEGRVLGRAGLDEDEVHAAVADERTPSGGLPRHASSSFNRFPYPFGTLVVVATPHAPFFGPEDQDLVHAIATLTGIALERVAEAERERGLRERLERLNALQNEFVAVVAHDLRSPMVVIAGYADLLVDRADRFDADDRREMLGTISRTVKKLARFVEDVLQVARIESGDFSYRIAPFELLPVVRGAVQDVAATGTRDRVQVVAPQTLPAALGDPERHWQILTNLLSNALKFSPPDTPIRVTVSVGDVLRVAVEDRGAGIAADDVDKLFLKFSRLNGDRAAGSEAGSGLGLYICKTMIEAQGGAIEVRSAPGVGSTFSYTIPIAETA